MLLAVSLGALVAFSPSPALRPACKPLARASHIYLQQIASPFASGGDASEGAATAVDPAEEVAASGGGKAGPGPYPLTLENVELVLDDMRPYLQADGGNVAVDSIEDGIVRLELQGACGSCPSSTMTMKMGLERGLLEKIPDIVAVEQVAPSGPQLTEEGIEEVLDEIRPFLKMAGGECNLVSLDAEGVQPTAKLAITGSGSTINSVRVEIAQRLKRNVSIATRFDMPSLLIRKLCHSQNTLNALTNLNGCSPLRPCLRSFQHLRTWTSTWNE